MAHKPNAGVLAPALDGHGGKLANDTNKQGLGQPTQKNQGRRTPASRGDRDTQLGADNQSRARKGGPGAPMGGKSR